jgi:hypothetical protein
MKSPPNVTEGFGLRLKPGRQKLEAPPGANSATDLFAKGSTSDEYSLQSVGGRSWRPLVQLAEVGNDESAFEARASLSSLKFPVPVFREFRRQAPEIEFIQR